MKFAATDYARDSSDKFQFVNKNERQSFCLVPFFRFFSLSWTYLLNLRPGAESGR